MKEHNVKLLDRCLSLGIKLNKNKCEFRKKEIQYIGHLVTNKFKVLMGDPV